MSIYAEYLERAWDFAALNAARKAQLQRIAQLRGNDVLVYAADLSKNDPKIAILYEDIVPFQDQIDNLHGTALDVILETPGGSGEVAEDVVKMLRRKYQRIAFIIPGTAKSAGTIMAMSGDEILMGPNSALGPIDAQLQWKDKIVSADAFLKGFEKIKASATQGLNRAYVPILSNISPGEIEHAENALNFAHGLVTDWLVRYKFKDWQIHSSDKRPVTEQDRKDRAQEIAKALSDQGRWCTHGRSLKIPDFEALRLQIVDYSQTPDLYDAIQRYHILLRMTFEGTSIFKLFETPMSQIVRHKVPPGQKAPISPQQADSLVISLQCPKCQVQIPLQANFVANAPSQPGALPFPANNQLSCPNCRSTLNVQDLRLQLESQAKRPILA